MKLIKGNLSWMSMHYSGLLAGVMLFGESLGGVARWRGDFKVIGFVEDFEVEFTLALVNVKGSGGGGGGGRGAERTNRFKQVFPSDINA